MARNTVIRTLSFDPEVFEAMELRRERLKMDRSEFIKRCILKDLIAGEAGMTIGEVPASLMRPKLQPAKKGRKKQDK